MHPVAAASVTADEAATVDGLVDEAVAVAAARRAMRRSGSP